MLISISVPDLTKISQELAGILAPDRVLTQDEDIIPYSFDGTAVLSQRPLAVAFATTTDEVSRVLKWANETRTPIIARGSGTGLAGAVFRRRAVSFFAWQNLTRCSSWIART